MTQWGAANHRALEDLEAIPRDHWLSIDYAELVAVPTAVVKRICSFAGIELDDRLAAALARPLPVSSTTISPPSPIKWRRNPEFRESALHGLTLLRARLRDLGRISAPPPPPKDPTTPIRFSCFVDTDRNPPAAGGDDWIVAPSFHFQIGATVPLGLVRRTRFRERFLADYPLLWVEDPATYVFYPFWICRGQALLFRQFVAGRPPPALSVALAARLVDAGILVTPARLESRRREGDALAEQARPFFEERRYCVLPSLIRATHVSALGRYYRDQIAYGDWASGDEQVSLRHGQHNETVSRYFHHQLTAFVGRVAGEPVKPSYAYVSAYREGAILKPHVDRKQCVFTLSLWIDRERPIEASSEPWPLWFQTHEGKISLTQGTGDGVLFRGCELPHWRDPPPPGGASTTLLFHYVPRDFADVLD